MHFKKKGFVVEVNKVENWSFLRNTICLPLSDCNKTEILTRAVKNTVLLLKAIFKNTRIITIR